MICCNFLIAGELWEYDPGKGSWVRQAAEPAVPTGAQPEARDSPVKKDKTPPDTTPQEGKLRNILCIMMHT